MTIKLTANLYSAGKDFFLFGQTKYLSGTGAGAVTLSAADTNAKTLNLLTPTWDYCPDATVTYTLANHDTEIGNVDTNCPPYHTGRTANGAGPADDTVAAGASAVWL